MLTTVVLTVLGALLVVAVAHDAVLATVSPGNGAGPLMRAMVRLSTWMPATPLTRLLPPGTVVLPGTVVVWTVLMWLGWTLLLGAGEGWVVDSTTSAPATGVDRLYYAGYTILTLGIGDYVPEGAWAQLMTIAACFNGLFLLTLAVTYQLNAVSAVVFQRGLAARVQGLGSHGQDVVDRWHALDGGEALLQGRLASMADDVVELTQRHLAYPVLHRFAVTAPQRSAPVAVAVLDQTLEVLAGSRGGRATASEQVLARAVDAYVEAVTTPGAGVPSVKGDGRDGRRGGLDRLLEAARQEWPGTGAHR